MILETDPEENETRYRYNDAGLPIEITDALGGIKTLTWTKDGQISSHTDCSGYTSRWQYDDRGRLQTQTDFRNISDREIRRVQDELNHRPRKILGYETPSVLFLSLFQPLVP